MDKALKADVKKYINQIRALLLCDAKTARHFLSDLENDIVNYIEDGNVQSMDDVLANFGDPETVARSFLETANTRKIRKRMRIRNVILCVLIAALLVWTCYGAYHVIDAFMDNRYGYGVETPAIALGEHTTADLQV